MKKLFLLVCALLTLMPPLPVESQVDWDSVAECESTNTNADTGNGYYGYYQFDQQTWESTGRTGLPTEYSKAEQTAAAQDLYAMRGGSPWPNCVGSSSPQARTINEEGEPMHREVTPDGPLRPASAASPTVGEDIAVTG